MDSNQTSTKDAVKAYTIKQVGGNDGNLGQLEE